MNNIISAKRNSAVFLATLLVLGTIATILPSAQAQQYYEDTYEPEYPSYSQDYEPAYPSDNNYYKSKDTNVILNKVKCNNINSNNNGVDVNLGLPNGNNAIDEDEDQATNTNGWGYGNEYKQKDNDFKFVCVNNNDNENNIIVINETTPIPPPEPTITCEECILENLTPEQLQTLNECFAEQQGCNVFAGGQGFFVDNLADLCEVLQDATILEIFEFFLRFTSILSSGRENLALVTVCLADVFNLTPNP